MNNNTPGVNLIKAASQTPSANMPKNHKIVNGTDNNGYCTNDTGGLSNASSSSTSNDIPFSSCQHTSSSSNADSQRQQNSVNMPPCNLNNLGNHQQNIPPHLSTDEEEECADSDDQYCVYTYKGDGSSQQPSRLAADLPSSFFKLHPSDSSSCPPSSSSSEIPSLEPSISSTRCCHSTTGSIQNGSLHNTSPGVVNNNEMYSPDMDFLEMDFDPGGSGDGCCEGDDEDDDEDVVRDHLFLGGSAVPGPSTGTVLNCVRSHAVPGPSARSSNWGGNNNEVLNDDQASAAVVLSKLVVTRSNGEGFISSSDSSVRDISSEPVPHCSKKRSNNVVNNFLCSSSHHGHNSAATSSLLNNCNRNDEIKLRLVKSVTLPEMGTSNSASDGSFSGVSCNSHSNNRAMAMSISAPVFQDKLDGPCPTVIPAGKSSENSMELEVDGVMIWSIQEAQEISINQIGRSACGATACLNVLSALGCIMTTLSPDFVNYCVGTRYRAEDADLPEYLLSRSNAGTTPEDLIAGIHRASNGLIYGRFFHIKPNTSPSTLNKWLLQWICKGAVPIATLNLQVRRPGEYCYEIPDAWHHQMIFGVTRQGIFLTNPLECVPTAELIPQLSSPSVLLVRRDDVTKRMGPRTDLRKLVRFADERWNEINVLGQVSNMLLEEMPVLNGSAGLARRIRTTHISIPASYQAGITLFIRESNATNCSLLKAAPEF